MKSKQNTIYLIPTTRTNQNPKKAIILEYLIVIRKKDMRTRFCKTYENYIVQEKEIAKIKNTPEVIIKSAPGHLFKNATERIIMPNAKIAREVRYKLPYQITK